MTAAVSCQTSLSVGGLSTACTVSSQHDETFDTIDLTAVTSEQAYHKLSQAARTTGVALVSNLPKRPPIAAIQKLFARLYGDPSLASRVNATYPKRGVFKSACLAPDASPQIDQKTTIDLSISRLQSIHNTDPTLVAALGEDFEEIVSFYTYIETEILPIVTRATSNISDLELELIHNGTNNHLRLIDYFPCPEPSAPRCGEHRDYNTYTIVFQDGDVGGLEFEVEGVWKPVPANVDAVISWGWCAAILSNDVVKAAKHRVFKTWPIADRRTTAVVFVAPDLDAVLQPIGDLGMTDKGWRSDIREGSVTVGAFKEIIAKKWRRREGNEPGEVVEGAQDREILEFLKPSCSG
ncbi:hypothetical protein NX059_004064 [Plenodomus lindquistii]|nr:hypothetical protein NX059_004064 [Plenodomus lindquistii]